jgi:hypothetical protein
MDIAVIDVRVFLLCSKRLCLKLDEGGDNGIIFIAD